MDVHNTLGRACLYKVASRLLYIRGKSLQVEEDVDGQIIIENRETQKSMFKKYLRKAFHMKDLGSLKYF